MAEQDDGGFDDEDAPVVIIDNGSGNCKAGLSLDEAPSKVFPSLVGRPRKGYERELAEEAYYGHQVKEHLNKLKVTYPLENGIIENFEDMESIWAYTFDEQLQVDPRHHPILLTEPPYNPKPNRERMVEIMFEVFQVPLLNISIQGVLALLGQGRTTGLVLDSGEGVTHTIPIFDGFGLPHCINRLDLAGRELNTLLAKLLAQEGYCLTTSQEQHHVRQMKETMCYCAANPATEVAEEVHYTLPDGRVIQLRDERWKCPEVLFNPSMMGLESAGVASLVWDSISRCDIDIRKSLLHNVVLSGGSTMFRGFQERLTRELKGFAPTASQANIKVVMSKDHEQTLAVWSGAQVYASLRHMQEDQWMTVDDYEEQGVSFIHDIIAVKYS